MDPKVYAFNIAVIGENSVVPKNVTVCKNTAISGITSEEDYPSGILAGGEYIIKAGEM